MAKKQSEKQRLMAEKRKEEKRKIARAERKKQRIKKVIRIVVICVLIVAVVVGAIVVAYKTHPLMHWFTVEETEHYTLNGAEISFYAWQIYQNYMDSASDSTTVPDTDVELSEQMYDDDMTWEEYFVESACSYAQTILALCEGAYENDFEPDYDVTEEAEYSVSTFDTSTFPTGVEDDDAITAMEYYFIALEYSEYMEEEITVSEEDLDTYCEENSEELQVCSYICFGFSYDDSDDGIVSSESVEEDAQELRHCATREAFEEWVTEYCEENYDSFTDEYIEEYVESLYTENAGYIEGDSVSEWAFSGEVSVGESTIIDEPDDEEEDEGIILVCLLLSEPELDTAYPVEMRQILLTSDTYGSTDDAESEAEEILEQWESGDQTEDTFAEYANYYSEDTSSDGGYYVVAQGDMSTSWQTWAYDEDRKAGDVAILENSYGVSIVYYIGLDEDTTGWELTATEAVEDEKYTEAYTDCITQADVQTSNFFSNWIKVYKITNE